MPPTPEQIAAAKELKSILSSIGALEETIEDKKRESLALSKRKGELARAEYEISQKNIAIEQSRLEILEKQAIIQEENSKQAADPAAIRAAEAAIAVKRQEIEALKDERHAIEENKAALISLQEVKKSAEATGRAFAESIGLTTVGLTKQIQALKEGNPEMGTFSIAVNLAAGRMKGLADQAMSFLNPLNLISRSLEGALGLDRMSAELTAATGLSREFAYEAHQLRTAVLGLGIGISQLVTSEQNLLEGFTDFNRLSGAQQAELTELTAKFNQLGVDVIPVVSFAMQGLGMSLTEASSLTMRLAGAADSLGRPMSQVMQDFQAAADDVVFFGERGEEAFMGLMQMAERTGVAVDALSRTFGVGGLFTTFDSTSQKVQELNAIFGSMGGDFIDVTQMMTADPLQKFQMIDQQLRSTGMEFSQLDDHIKFTIAQTLNQSLEETQRMFEGVNDAASRNADMLANHGMTTAQFDARVQDASDSMTVLKESFNNFMGAIAPLTRFLSRTIDKVSEAAAKFGEFFDTLEEGQQLLAGGGLMIAISAIGSALSGIAGALGIGAVGGGLVGGLGAVFGIVGSAAGILAGAAIGFAAFGAAVALAGSGVRQMAEGLQIIDGLESPEHLRAIFGVVSDIPKDLRFAPMGRSFKQMGEGVAMIETENANAAARLIGSATAYNETAAEQPFAGFMMLANAIRSIGGGSASAAGGGAANVNVKVYMNGREIAAEVRSMNNSRALIDGGN
jgi:hypothetical protein